MQLEGRSGSAHVLLGDLNDLTTAAFDFPNPTETGRVGNTNSPMHTSEWICPDDPTVLVFLINYARLGSGLLGIGDLCLLAEPSGLPPARVIDRIAA